MITFDCNNAVKTVADFHRLLLDLQTVINECNDEVVECDKAFGDIRHYCELHYPADHKGKAKVCKLMLEYSERRRKAKDTMEVLEPLTCLLNAHKTLSNDVSACKGKMIKAQAKITGKRKYNPRVLTELFEDRNDDD